MQKFLKFFFISSFTYTSLALMAENNTQTSVQKGKTTLQNGSTTLQDNQITQFEKYTNPEKGYSIEYPTNWKKSDVPQLDFVLFAPTGKNDKTHASINVVSEKVGSDINLELFFNESTKNLTSALKDVKIEKTGTAFLNGTPAKWVQYTHNIQGITFKVLQYFIVSGESIYLLTYSASEEDFNKFRPDSEQIANTFKLVK